MLQSFEVIKPLFEGQANEHFQFKVNIEGNDYRGIFHNEEVHWFQPQPQPQHNVESIVLELVSNHLPS
ncbi:hypothetical protein SAMN05518871_102555 [Psychrobacillus sp. OK028]|uniref:hypothetical protein n=1 Tax=Psychrobacillus sp. OK028 TaxID=1884359 RepID=UPI00088DF7AA|nr:hypothetical protein [Psychrobacillus sp. OK028]SDM91549.1 hypothetical protein SAMN05518871_102555 [Psychrobacillus sp. OK028]